MRHRIQALLLASLAVASAGSGCTSVLGDITFDRSTGGAGGDGGSTSSSGTGGATASSSSGTGGASTSSSSGTGGATASSSSSAASSSSGGVMCGAGKYEYPAGSGTCIDDPCLPNPCDHPGLCANDTGSAVCTCVFFADGAAAGAGNGTSWKDAFTDIQSAVDAASAEVKAGATTCDVWVKEGTYRVYDASDTHNGLVLRQNVGVYGGFAGTETLRTAADPKAHPTILNGQDATDPTLHVNHTVAVYDAENVTLDGFTIRGGSATQGPTPEDQKGGGVMAYVFNGTTSLTISRCEITANAALSGGGIGVAAQNNHPLTITVIDSDIHGNSSAYGGGGMSCAGVLCTLKNTSFCANTGSSGAGLASFAPTVADHVTFAENISSGDGGGLWLQYQDASTALTNLVFRGNRAGSGRAGGLMLDGTSASVKLVNAAFVGNTAIDGGAIYDGTTSGITCIGCTITANRGTTTGDGISWANAGPTLHNSIVWGNPSPTVPSIGKDIMPATWAMITATHSDIHGYTPSGGTVLDQSPLFVSLPTFFDAVASAAASTTTVTVSSSSKYASGDVIEIGGDGVARTVSASSSNVVTFAPALGAPAPAGTSIRNWGTALGTIDLHVGAASPCINTADASLASTTDVEGDARIGAPDIGAYESH
ncbi:Xanthine/uracil/thiamine/ascorbate permease family protein [Minicystis rosea]|nr:Xanthine/uracil/thiamine/ascorbate permease family protein [Minicystis rosea]